MKKTKVNILGTTYTVKESDKTDPKMLGNDGYCDNSSKEIVTLKSLKIRDDIRCIENLYKYAKKVLRHEVIHAFFSESGLEAYEKNEELVDWIASQYPKIKEVFKKLNVED